MFRIWIGNLGKYNEGELIGEWVDLPCDDFDAVFERIGINERYEEIFIADFDNDYGYEVGEWDNLEMLNERAETLEGLNDFECDVWEALHDDGLDYEEIIEIIERGDYICWWNCDSMGDVAYAEFESSGRLSELERHIDPSYIDWAAIGRDMSFEGSYYPCGNGYIEVLR